MVEKNPLIERTQKIIPATTVRLPSRGIFYKNGEIDEVSNGEITLYPMTTLDEIIIRSPDMLYQGTAIEKIISRCAPQVKKPLELLAKDVDYLLVMLRKLTYGNSIVVPITCTTKIEKAENQAEIDNIQTNQYTILLDSFTSKSKELDDSIIEKYKIVLTSGIVIHLRPSKFIEMLQMYQINDDTKTPEELENIIIQSILAVIKDVEDIENSAQIKEWLHVLPVSIMKEITNKISDVNNWGPDFKYTIDCKDCGGTHDISYILNPVSFFMLPSSLAENQN